MSNASIYRPKMKESEVRETILFNLTKMLMARGELDGYNLMKQKAKKKLLKKHYEALIKTGNDDYIYTITGVPRMKWQKSEDKESEEKKEFVPVITNFAIKIYPDDLSSVNIQPIKDFLNEYPQHHKILIVKSATQNPYDEFKKNPNTEIFYHTDLLQCVLELQFQPIFIPMLNEPNMLDKMIKKFNIEKNQFCDIFTDKDPIALFFNLNPDDIIMIISPNENSGYSVRFRRAKKGNRFKLSKVVKKK